MFLLILLIVFFKMSKAQDENIYLKSKLISGCPKDLEQIKDQMGLSKLSYSTLETGIDTLKIIFGTMQQQEVKGYWYALCINNKFATFSTGSLEKLDSSDILSKNIDLFFYNSSKRISFKVMHRPSSDEIAYCWINNKLFSKTAMISNVEKPIEMNKKFPLLKFEALNGDTVSIKDFTDKYLVINWWNTGCAPCRVEMPNLNKLVEKYKSNSNVVFLAIAFDKKDRLESFLKTREFKYIQTLANKDIAKIFGESYPKNIIVNPKGLITYYKEGASEYTPLEIEQALKAQIIKH